MQLHSFVMDLTERTVRMSCKRILLSIGLIEINHNITPMVPDMIATKCDRFVNCVRRSMDSLLKRQYINTYETACP